MTAEPPNKGELEYGSILPNGEDWRLRKFDAGMGETEYRVFKNEKFFAMFDNREDADIVMGLVTRAPSAEKVLEEKPECFGTIKLILHKCLLCKVNEQCYDKRQELRQQEREQG